MPDPALSQALREVFASAPTDAIVFDTLELRHPSFSEPIRVVRNFTDIQTWIDVGGASVQAVLDALDAETRDKVGLVARLEADAPANPGELVPWIAMAFELERPPVESIPLPEVGVTIDAVDRTVTDALDAAATSTDLIEVTYRPYLSTDLEGPQMDPPMTFVMSQVQANLLRVTGRARLLDIGNLAFPRRTYTVAEFPLLAT